MREAGVSRSEIGYLSLWFLPLLLKFFWAPVVDRIRPFARAHRAGWVIVTQTGVILSLLCLIPLGATNVWGIIAVGLVGSFLISTQDIATDGYATKYLAPGDRPIGNAIQGGSVAFGVVIGGTLGLVLYAQIGWTGMLLTIAGFSLIPLFAAFAMRESEAEAIDLAKPKPSIMAFLRRREVRNILWIALIYRMSEGLVKAMEGSYLVDAGVPLAQIGYLSGGAGTPPRRRGLPALRGPRGCCSVMAVAGRWDCSVCCGPYVLRCSPPMPSASSPASCRFSARRVSRR